MEETGEYTVLPAKHDPPHGRRVVAQGDLVAGLEVEAAHLPVHTRGEGLVAVGAEADVHDGGAVLVRLQQRAVAATAAAGVVAGAALLVGVVQVHVLVPGGDQQPRRRVGREVERRDGVVGRLRELELRCCFGVC